MTDKKRLRLRIDPFLVSLLATVALASMLPLRGTAVAWGERIAAAAIALLFFLHGAKLSREAITAGLKAWRIHLLVMAATFLLFPLLGLLLRLGLANLVAPTVTAGLLFLCLLPSTVQSSIAFTSIAGGNVPAAVCSASLTNLAGIFLTPVLVAWLMGAGGSAKGLSPDAIGRIALQLLLPFVMGHLCRPWVASLLCRHDRVIARTDRGSILLVVYTAFSASVVEGLWHKVGVGDLAAILLVDALLLAVVLLVTCLAARRLGFDRRDEIVIVFCGSKKSLASGVPMAGALFPAATVGPIILPLMLFHQIQLMVCAILSARYAQRHETRFGVAALEARV